MTPCKEKGYEVGQVFKVTDMFCSGSSKEGDIVVLIEDDGSPNPWFFSVTNPSFKRFAANIAGTVRIYPPEETQTATVICEGKETILCREDAKKLNLV